MTKAGLKNYRQSPRKVRLVADMIKGQNAESAMRSLDFLAKDAARPIKKLIQSALANAKNKNIDPEKLFVKDIQVNPGAVLKRRMPRARGTAYLIKKRTSHITLILSEKESEKSQ